MSCVKRSLALVVLTMFLIGFTIPSISHAQDIVPIAGAKVFLEGPCSVSVTTGYNGEYVIAKGLETGTYSIGVNAPGYIDAKLENKIIAGQETTNINFFLKHSGVISGIVYASPLSPTCTCCRPPTLEELGILVTATQTTGTGGNLSSCTLCNNYIDPDSGLIDLSASYIINAGLSTGTYKVTAEMYGYVPYTSYDIKVTAGQETPDVNISLEPAGVMSGTVMTPDGMPLFRALVTAHSSQYSGSAYTNSTGYFKIVRGLGGITNNLYNVFLQYKTYSSSRSNIEVHQMMETFGINFRLDIPSSGSIIGRLTDDDGRIIRNGSIQATGSAGQAEARTDGDGYYSVLLGAGEYTVSASAAGFYPSSPTHVTVAVNQQESIDLELTRISGVDSGRISGKVTGEATPIPEFEVSVLVTVYVITTLIALLASHKISSQKRTKLS